MIKASECNVQLPMAKIIAIKQFQERLFLIDGQIKKQWVHPQGDHLSLLNIMEAYLHVKDKHSNLEDAISFFSAYFVCF